MAKATIHAGVCGFTTHVLAESEDAQTTQVSIVTSCPNLKPMENNPIEVDGFSVCFGKVGEGDIYAWCRPHCIHAACPVPAGIIKTVEVECELALPRPVSIELEK